MDYTVHSPETAHADAKQHLEHSQQAYGFVPNLHGIMAEAPALLEGYKAVSQIFEKTSLTPAEKQTVLLTVSHENECHYCMAAHSVIAEMQKVPADAIEALRDGSPIADDRLEALRQFTLAMVRKRGWPSDEDVSRFLAAGFTQANVLEVILGIVYKTLSNYTNHLADTPVDQPFQKAAWSKAA